MPGEGPALVSMTGMPGATAAVTIDGVALAARATTWLRDEEANASAASSADGSLAELPTFTQHLSPLEREPLSVRIVPITGLCLLCAMCK
jgi:hypothetical protein